MLNYKVAFQFSSVASYELWVLGLGGRLNIILKEYEHEPGVLTIWCEDLIQVCKTWICYVNKKLWLEIFGRLPLQIIQKIDFETIFWDVTNQNNIVNFKMWRIWKR